MVISRVVGDQAATITEHSVTLADQLLPRVFV